MKLVFSLSNGETLTITNKQLLSTSFVDFTSNSDEVRIGTASSCELDVEIKNYNKELTNYNFSNSEFDAFWDDGTQIGHFYVSNVDKTRSSWKIESEDILNRTDITWNGRTFPCSIYEILASICLQCNISLYNTKEDFENFNIMINTYENLEGKTCRDIIKFIAEVLGTFATVNPYGQLVFKWYDTNDTKTTIKYGDTTSFVTNEVDTKRDGILIINGNSNVQVGDTSCSFIIDNNPLLESCSDNELYNIANNIWNNIKGTEFAAGEFELRTRKGLRAGDTIKVVEENGKERIAIVVSLEINNDVSSKIISNGDNSNVGDSKSTSTSGRDTKETYSTEVFFGRAKNNQRIHAKKGTYVVCEKLVKNVTKFTQVNMEISVLFKYTPNKMIYFSLYANDILLRKEIPFWCHEGLNYFSLAEVSDTTGIAATDYLLKIRVDDDCEVDIQPFDAIMSLKVKGGRIDDVQATDQYFSERIKEFSSGTLTWKKLGFNSIVDRLNLDVTTLEKIAEWDISNAQDGGVMATLYDNGLLYCVGVNATTENFSTKIPKNDYRPWETNYSDFIKEIRTKNLYKIPDRFVCNSVVYPNLKKVTLNKNAQIIGEYICNAQYNDTDMVVTFENNYIDAYEIGKEAFKDCSNLVLNNPTFTCKHWTTINGNDAYVGILFQVNGYTGVSHAFRNCINIKGDLTFLVLSSVAIGAFTGCTGIERVRIVERAYKIIDNAKENFVITFKQGSFDGCSSLRKVIMDFVDIPYGASLNHSITVPQDVNLVSVHDDAFMNTAMRKVWCPNRDEFSCRWSSSNCKPYHIGDGAFKNTNAELCLNGTKISSTDNYNTVMSEIAYQGFTSMIGYVLEE